MSSSPNDELFCTWSIRRPGVAIIMSGRVFSSASCALTERPPTHRQNRTCMYCASAIPTLWHWIASSRVGQRITTRDLASSTPFCRYDNRSRIGIKNAAVLPLPVTAPATMSLPASAMGIVRDWIGVGFWKFIALKARNSARFRRSAENDAIGASADGSSAAKYCALRSASASSSSSSSLSSSSSSSSDSDASSLSSASLASLSSSSGSSSLSSSSSSSSLAWFARAPVPNPSPSLLSLS